MDWPIVCDYAFLGHTLSCFETTIVFDDNTIVLHKTESYSCSSLSKLKIFRLRETKVISFRGFIICYIVVLESILGMSYFYFYIEH